uniref:Albumin domain-containing protein n=1 Tax=Varanus komodoensis TaxID=61221 RepID=A0A8D2J6V8_VARKO
TRLIPPKSVLCPPQLGFSHGVLRRVWHKMKAVFVRALAYQPVSISNLVGLRDFQNKCYAVVCLTRISKTVSLFLIKQYFNSVHQSLIFGHLMCHDNALIEKYGYTACCAKEGAEEEECFHALKNEAVIPVYQHPPAEEALYRFSAALLSIFLKNYVSVSLEYCQKLANLAQKFPKATAHDLEELAKDIVHAHEECCKGHEVECLLARGDMIAHVCDHQEKYSTKVHDCCEKPWLDRADCLINVENDEKPADLSATTFKCCYFYSCSCLLIKPFLCYSFTYEYARRHPEFSIQLLGRLTDGYEDLLVRCCAMEHPETCLPEGEEMLKKHVAETLEVVKKNCDAHSKLGDYFFHNELLTSYTKKAPQLEGEELLKYTKGFVGVANRCCNLDEGHKLKCAEENTGLVLGSICARHDDHNINKQVCKCCSGHYDDLRECFGGLGVDPEYHAPAFNADLFHLDEGICTDAPEEAQRKKQTLLINMIKTKPDITEEQLVSAIVDFQGLVTNCCEAENHKVCFDTEVYSRNTMELKNFL